MNRFPANRWPPPAVAYITIYAGAVTRALPPPRPDRVLGCRDMRDERIYAYIDGLSGWRREAVAHLRELVHEAVPDIGEAWKWDTPVFVKKGNVCAIGVFADHVKVNFLKGASLADPDGLFNAGLEAKTSRAIDLREGDLARLDVNAFRSLVQAAAAS